MKKIVITGATSFIGVNLIKSLSAKEYYIYAIIRQNSLKKDLLPSRDNMEIIECDLNEMDKLTNIIKQKCEIFIHLAWDGSKVNKRNDKQIQAKNITGSIKTLTSAKILECKAYFYAGTMLEYGTNDIVNEESLCTPKNEYGKAKYFFYKYAHNYASINQMRFVAFRFSCLYGPNDNEQKLMVSLINRFKANEPVSLNSGNKIWNYLYIDDAINAINILLRNPDANGVYNIGSSKSQLLKEYVFKMKEIIKSCSEITIGDNTADGINPDVKKMLTLGWKEKYTFEEGIKKII